MQSNLNILLLSDLHLNDDLLEAMLAQVQQRHQTRPYHYVFMSGDLCDLPNSGPESEFDQVAIREAHDRIKNWVARVQDAVAPVLLIPGNHDPPSWFSPEDGPQDLMAEANVHGRTRRLADGLYVAGLGGCVQDFYIKGGTEPPVKCWSPYPYTEEDHSGFAADLQKLWA